MKFVRLVLYSVSSPRLQEKSGRGNMVVIAVEAVPAGSRPPAVDDSMRTCTGLKMWLWRFCAFVNQGVTNAFFGSLRKRFGYHAEAGRTGRAVLDSIISRRAIPVHHSICCSVLRTRASLGVWFYVCLRGETWVPSFMIKAC